MFTGFIIMLSLLCAIYHLDQELDDQTQVVIVLISDSWLTLLEPDYNVTLITVIRRILSVYVFIHVLSMYSSMSWQSCMHAFYASLLSMTCNEIMIAIFLTLKCSLPICEVVLCFTQHTHNTRIRERRANIHSFIFYIKFLQVFSTVSTIIWISG